MKFYDEKEAIYLETDSSGGGLGTGSQQIREGLSLHEMKHLETQDCIL